MTARPASQRKTRAWSLADLAESRPPSRSVLVDHSGKPSTWRSLGCGHGTLITCTADGSGGLAFRVDDGPWCAVPNFAFPHDAPLRRWAFVPDKEDQVYHEEEEMFIPV